MSATFARHFLRPGAPGTAPSRPVLVRSASHRSAIHGPWAPAANPSCAPPRRTPTSSPAFGRADGSALCTRLRKGPTPHKVIVFGTKQWPSKKAAAITRLGARDHQILPDRHRAGSPEETLEIFAFMEAADESKRQGGAPVNLSEVVRKTAVKSKPKRRVRAPRRTRPTTRVHQPSRCRLAKISADQRF